LGVADLSITDCISIPTEVTRIYRAGRDTTNATGSCNGMNRLAIAFLVLAAFTACGAPVSTPIRATVGMVSRRRLDPRRLRADNRGVQEGVQGV